MTVVQESLVPPTNVHYILNSFSINSLFDEASGQFVFRSNPALTK